MRKTILSVTEEDFEDSYIDDYEYLIGDYIVREWTFGEREDIIEMASVQKIDPKTKEMEIQMKSSKFRVLTLAACMESTPFGKATIKMIRGLPVFFAEYLFAEVSKLNEVVTEDSLKKFKSD